MEDFLMCQVLDGVQGTNWLQGNNWLQVDFGKEFYVSAVATQGGRFGFITDFKLLYSNDEGTWQTYQNGNGEELVIWMSIWRVSD